MRPIIKGEHPSESGQPKLFKEYQEARGDLIDRLGQYCSYCEMKLDTALAIEHIRPKSLYPNLELEWSNFLLACTNCNSTKGTQDIILSDYYWPDEDNTFLAFTYLEGGLVRPNSQLNNQEKIKAEATLKLTGLDKPFINDPKVSNRLLLNRRYVWDLAIRSLDHLHKNDTPEMRQQITCTATGHAYWSIWMTVFKDDSDMLKRFIEAFPGTCQDCFDDNCNPIPRPNGNL
jgi:uncharacterized protein (TIGR02646 family)